MKHDFVIPKADYKIAGIWRTSKVGFLETINELKSFFNDHTELTFTYVVIGSGNAANELMARTMLEDCKNVKVVFLGYVYPIPLSLIKEMDVFVSTAGSVRVPAKYDIPSIAVTTDKDANGNVRFWALGIFEYTTLNTVMPEETGCTLSDYLAKVLFQGLCKNKQKMYNPLSEFDETTEFGKQLGYFENDELENYYEISKILPVGLREWLYCFVGKICGQSFLVATDNIMHKIKTHKEKRT